MNKGVVFLNFPSTKSKPDNFLGNQTGKLMGVRFRGERERERSVCTGGFGEDGEAESPNVEEPEPDGDQPERTH